MPNGMGTGYLLEATSLPKAPAGVVAVRNKNQGPLDAARAEAGDAFLHQHSAQTLAAFLCSDREMINQSPASVMSAKHGPYDCPAADGHAAEIGVSFQIAA